MSPDLLVRALWALFIAGLLLVAYWAFNWLIVARVRNRRLGLEGFSPGVPGILYFTTPTCVPCKTIQRPALARLQERMTDSLQVIEIDAADRSDLADYWGVLSVPTTFIIDARGRPRRVNHGVSSAEKLYKQIEAVEAHPFAFRTILSKASKQEELLMSGENGNIDLNHAEILRYSRHLLIPEVGLSGQKKIKAASVLVIGTGGLGSPVALYLAAAGVGRIGLVDYDVVDSSNLQRQVIHGTSQLGQLKVESARQRMLDINPDIQVEVYNEPFTSENALRIAQDYDILDRWHR